MCIREREGGKIIIGVNDLGQVVGTDTSNNARSKIQDTINQIEPRPNTTIDVHENIIIVTVREGKEKPYSCSKGFYLRSGPNSQKLDRNNIIEFLRSELIIRYDSKLRKEYSVNDNFNQASYDKFIEKADIDDKLPSEHVLRNLECAGYSDDGDLVYTNAGALFFRNNTQDNFFEYAKVVAYCSKEQARQRSSMQRSLREACRRTSTTR